ncbi:MAG: [protein-PII] uridylyltransferase [Deltaproteobacteria bacterium]|nr:[protein-PII] uridylyltransferase [Deltaproteobacteria bacterium]
MTLIKDELKVAKENLMASFRSGKIVESFHEVYSEMMDQYFRTCIQESLIGIDLFNENTPFALIAVGGYGRRELCIHSDIDILIVFNKSIPESAKVLAGEIFYPLWDLRLDLGYGIRTVGDCISLAKKDFEVFTSMLDARFICGDSPLFLHLMEDLETKVVKKKTDAFGVWLENVYKTRLVTFGDASHLLEPNLKDGIGGLRDYHHLLWLAKVLFQVRDPKDLEYTGKLSYKEYEELTDQIRFILKVRNFLHEISGRKNDRLNFEYQEDIAGRLGFKNKKKIAAVEQFLGELHASMEVIKILHRSYVRGQIQKKHTPKGSLVKQEITKGLYIHHNELNFHSSTVILSNPFLLMEIFEQSSRLELPLSVEARRLVKEFLQVVNDPFRSDEKVIHSFLNIINSKDTTTTLDQMLETGFLETFIPEFGKIKNRVQFDAYHIFPVGRHILETVKYLKDLPKEKDILLPAIFMDLPFSEPLFLAGLFHDIGKDGKGHALRGVNVTNKILKRFRYPKNQTGDILFLIENHLLLIETATRRDLNDEKIIVQCARHIGNTDRLKMLYLLTWADSRATGPRAWNDWIGNLVQELFFKILHILERGELATPDSSQKVASAKMQIQKMTADRITARALAALFEVMPPRYLLNTDPLNVIHHLEMIDQLKHDSKSKQSTAFVLDARENTQKNIWEVCFVARDRPGLFSDIAGVMALNNINILSSNIYTWVDGIAVDIFSVTRPLDLIHPGETWKKVEKDFLNTFSGKISLPYRLGQKAAPSILSGTKKPVRPPEVVVDNQSSDFFTLVEVFAPDRIGLLYLITRTLFDLRLDIRVAKTGVKGDHIADIFYVRDLEGQKVEDEEQVREIKRALIYQLTKEQSHE